MLVYPLRGGAVVATPQPTRVLTHFEPSQKKEDKEQKNKILLAAASVLAVIGIGVAICKGKGSKAIEAAENGVKNLAKKGQEAGSHSKVPDVVQPQKVELPQAAQKPIEAKTPNKPLAQPQKTAFPVTEKPVKPVAQPKKTSSSAPKKPVKPAEKSVDETPSKPSKTEAKPKVGTKPNTQEIDAAQKAKEQLIKQTKEEFSSKTLNEIEGSYAGFCLQNNRPIDSVDLKTLREIIENKRLAAAEYKKVLNLKSDTELRNIYEEVTQGKTEMNRDKYEVLKEVYEEKFDIVPVCNEKTQIQKHSNICGKQETIRYEDVPAHKEVVEALHRDFEKLPPLEQDIICYRGRTEELAKKSANVDFDIIEKANPGNIINPDKGCPYAAFHRSLAECWSIRNPKKGGPRAMIMAIKVPKGAKVSRNMEHGGEVVFPPNPQFKLISKGKDPDGVMNVVLEYIPNVNK